MDLSGREIAALITAVVGVCAFIFSIFRFSGERRDGRDVSTFDSREAIRSFYLKTATDIMDAVSRVMSPVSKDAYRKAWYDISHLYTGPSRLLPSAKGASISEAFTEFMNEVWSAWHILEDQDDDEDFGQTTRRWNNMNKKSAALSTALQKMLNEQFHIDSTVMIKTKDRVEETQVS